MVYLGLPINSMVIFHGEFLVINRWYIYAHRYTHIYMWYIYMVYL